VKSINNGNVDNSYLPWKSYLFRNNVLWVTVMVFLTKLIFVSFFHALIITLFFYNLTIVIKQAFSISGICSS